ncbi:MAG: hypothetical protein ABDH91_01600 [Bacteroidia bacterium]
MCASTKMAMPQTYKIPPHTLRKCIGLWTAFGLSWAQGWAGLRDSFMVENERIEVLELTERPFPPLPELAAPAWRLESPSWQGAPLSSPVLVAPYAPTRPTWTKLAPLHFRYSLGRFLTQQVQVSWGHTRDLERDGGIAFQHHSTPIGHVTAARWGTTTLQGWWGRYSARQAFEVRYRGSYEKFFFYAPLAEGWLSLEDGGRIPDTLRGHFWRQELTLSARDTSWGGLRFTTRRLDLRQGLPEWQVRLSAESPYFVLSPLSRLRCSAEAFGEGPRFLLKASALLYQETKVWHLRLGLLLGLGRDSSLRFLGGPQMLALYKGFSSLFRPYLQAESDLIPLTYFSATELNPYVRRRAEPLPLLRQWLQAEFGSQGQGIGWDYRLAAEYRFQQGALVFLPHSYYFALRGLPYLHSLGGILAFQYLPQPTGPQAELRAAYRHWLLPRGWTYYSIPHWELTARLGYNWEEKFYFALRMHAIGARSLSDTLTASPFVDISWEAHLRFLPIMSFFVEMNNLLNRRFYRWYGYRERPLDIRLGIWLKIG